MRIFFHCPSVKRRYKLPLQLFPVLREPSDLKTPLVDSEEFVAGVYRWKKMLLKLCCYQIDAEKNIRCAFGSKIEIAKLLSIQPWNERGGEEGEAQI